MLHIQVQICYNSGDSMHCGQKPGRERATQGDRVGEQKTKYCSCWHLHIPHDFFVLLFSKGDIRVTIQIDTRLLHPTQCALPFPGARHIQTQYPPHKIRRKNALRSRACFASSEQTSHRPSDATINTLAERISEPSPQAEPRKTRPCAFYPG